MLLAPLTAVILLVPVAAAVALGRALDLSPLVIAVLAVALLALGSRGLHLDGLADTSDGLAASYDRERALQIMRTGDVGPAGAATLLLTLALQIACATSLLANNAGMALAGFAVVASRLGLTFASLRGVPPARPEGLGATMAGTVPRAAAVAAAVVITGAGALVLELAGASWWAAPLVLLGVAASTAVVVARCTRRLGGITGDVLGAVVEIGVAATLLVAAASL